MRDLIPTSLFTTCLLVCLSPVKCHPNVILQRNNSLGIERLWDMRLENFINSDLLRKADEKNSDNFLQIFVVILKCFFKVKFQHLS